MIKKKEYQWKNENARINYQLQKETLCGKAWIDVESPVDLNMNDEER